jgi:hypothetical protein
MVGLLTQFSTSDGLLAMPLRPSRFGRHGSTAMRVLSGIQAFGEGLPYRCGVGRHPEQRLRRLPVGVHRGTGLGRDHPTGLRDGGAGRVRK